MIFKFQQRKFRNSHNQEIFLSYATDWNKREERILEYVTALKF